MAPDRPSSIEVGTKGRSAASPLVVTLVVVTIVGIVIGLAGLFLPRAIGYADGSTGSSRNAALSVVKDFAVTYNTYDAAELDDYQQRVGGLLAKSYREEFIKVTDSIFTALKAKKQSSGDANVRQVAIESIDSDSAELLVAVDAKLKNTDNDKAIPRSMRWLVSLTKVDGEWKVDSFESVAALQLETGTPESPAPKSDEPESEAPKSETPESETPDEPAPEAEKSGGAK